jgi:hypothetical protein
MDVLERRVSALPGEMTTIGNSPWQLQNAGWSQESQMLLLEPGGSSSGVETLFSISDLETVKPISVTGATCEPTSLDTRLDVVLRFLEVSAFETTFDPKAIWISCKVPLLDGETQVRADTSRGLTAFEMATALAAVTTPVESETFMPDFDPDAYELY